MDIATDDWKVFEATTTGVGESKGNIHRRVSSDALRVKQAKAAGLKFVEDGIDESAVAPVVAFEIFAGKQFTTTGDQTSTNLSDSVAKQQASTERSRVRRLESPLERYHRLKTEVDELAHDVSTMTTEETATTTTAAAAPWNEMASGLQAMQQQLSQIAETSVMKSAGLSLPNQASIHSVLSSRLVSEVEHLQQSSTAGAPPPAPDTPPEATTSEGPSYEVYLNSTTTDALAAARMSSLEARFARVEKALGSSSSDAMESVAGDGLVAMMQELEGRVNLLNPATLDSVGRRVSALSSELEKFIKLKKRQARNGGGEGGGSSSSSSSDLVRTQQVNELWALVESLGTLDKELPLIVERLETLQSLHAQTATFEHRLRSTEESMTFARAETKEYSKAVEAMEKSVLDNVEMMSMNMKVLDDKFAARE